MYMGIWVRGYSRDTPRGKFPRGPKISLSPFHFLWALFGRIRPVGGRILRLFGRGVKSRLFGQPYRREMRRDDERGRDDAPRRQVRHDDEHGRDEGASTSSSSAPVHRSRFSLI